MPVIFPAGLQQSHYHSWHEVHSAPMVERCSGDKRDPLCAEWTRCHLQKEGRTPAALCCSGTPARLLPSAARPAPGPSPIFLGSGPSHALFSCPVGLKMSPVLPTCPPCPVPSSQRLWALWPAPGSSGSPGLVCHHPLSRDKKCHLPQSLFICCMSKRHSA